MSTSPDDSDEAEAAGALPRTDDVHWVRDSLEVAALVDESHTWPGKLMIGSFWFCWWLLPPLCVLLITRMAPTLPVGWGIAAMSLFVVLTAGVLWKFRRFVRGLRDFRTGPWLFAVALLFPSIIVRSLSMLHDEVTSGAAGSGLIPGLLILGLTLLFFGYLLKRRRAYGWYVLKEKLGMR